MIRNVGLNSALNIYRAGIQFGLNIALAQFLTLADFGQVALVLPLTLFILLIGDFGITGAIMRSSASAREAGAAATICEGFGLAIPLVTGLLYLIGALDGIPHPIAELLLAFSVVALLAMLAVVPRAMLERGLRYGHLTIVETIANTAAFVVAVTSAAYGGGVWSFVLYHITMQAIRSTFFWSATRGDIQRNFALKLAVPLMSFGGWVVAFNLVNYLMRNLDRYIVDAWMGTNAVGLYAMAYQVMLLPVMIVTWPVSGVLLSTLSRMKDQPEQRRDTFFAVLLIASCITFPMMTFVALKSRLIFGTILPAGWTEVGPVIGTMAIAGGLQSVTALVGALFLISGRVQAQFWFGVAATLITLVTLFGAAATVRSLSGLANAYVVLTAVLSLGYIVMIARLLDTRITSVVWQILPAIGLSAAAALLMLLVDGLIAVHLPIVRLLIDMAVFGGMFAVTLFVGRTKFMQLLAILRRSGQIVDV